MEEGEKRRTYIEQRGKPEPLGKGYWIVARRHPEKSYPEAWQWVEGGEPPTTELPPVSPTYPTTKPPREDVPMGGLPKGDRD